MTAALTGRGCKPLALRLSLIALLNDKAALVTCRVIQLRTTMHSKNVTGYCAITLAVTVTHWCSMQVKYMLPPLSQKFRLTVLFL